MLPKIKLSVKIGFGVGEISVIYVGGVLRRCEYLPAGLPLTQAFQSEHLCSKGGETIVSMEVYNMVSQFFSFEPVSV
jgi:adenylate cyclase 10